MSDPIRHLPPSINPSLPAVPAIDGSFLTEFFYSRINDTIPSENKFIKQIHYLIEGCFIIILFYLAIDLGSSAI